MIQIKSEENPADTPSRGRQTPEAAFLGKVVKTRGTMICQGRLEVEDVPPPDLVCQLFVTMLSSGKPCQLFDSLNARALRLENEKKLSVASWCCIKCLPYQ